MPSADQRAAALGGSSLVPRRGYSGSPPSQWPSRSRYGNAYRAAPYWRGEPQRWIIGMPFPDIDVAAGTVTLAIWQSAILAGLLLLFVFLAVYRAQWPTVVGPAVRLSLALFGIVAAWTVVDRLAERDRADERRALDQRILELSARALAPGSALGCLEPNLISRRGPSRISSRGIPPDGRNRHPPRPPPLRSRRPRPRPVLHQASGTGSTFLRRPPFRPSAS